MFIMTSFVVYKFSLFCEFQSVDTGKYLKVLCSVDG